MSVNISLIRESLSALKPHASQVIAKFYEELYVRYPQARGILSEPKRSGQERNVINLISHIAEYFEDTEHLPDYLRKMGGRYAAYSKNPECFSWIEEAMLSTLAYFFEEQWTAELTQSWAEAFTYVIHEMQIGMEVKLGRIAELKTRETNTPHLEQIARQFAEDLFKKAVDEYVESPKFQEAVRQKAQEIFKKAIELEAKQMMQEFQSLKRTNKIHAA